MGILQEKVMDTLVGHWVVQTVIKLVPPRHITMAAIWLENNMQGGGGHDGQYGCVCGQVFGELLF